MTSLTQNDRIEQEAHAWLSTCGHSIQKIEKIPGDASTRIYFRVFENKKTFILMKMEPFQWGQSSEATTTMRSDAGDTSAKMLFLSVQEHLREAQVDVPRVVEVNGDKGFILLEDLGDVMLLRYLQSANDPNTEIEAYFKVMDELVKLHVAAGPNLSVPHAMGPKRDLAGFRLSFDEEKLMWEVGHTFEHFYKGYLKREIPKHDLDEMILAFKDICQKLAAEPKVFTHRDFHSRNIMLPDGLSRVVMIDFQDARMGPAQYDLASLLRDSYYQLSDDVVEKSIEYYITKIETLTNGHIDRPHFRKCFDLMAIQRNFKAIGSFASFYCLRGNAGYLKYIGNTFENIRRTLVKYPEYHGLREKLFHYYYF